MLHPDKPNVSVKDLQKELADKYRGKESCVFVFGLKTQFGGGKSTGFGLIYDSEAMAKAAEPKYRLCRVRSPTLSPTPPSCVRSHPCTAYILMWTLRPSCQATECGMLRDASHPSLVLCCCGAERPG